MRTWIKRRLAKIPRWNSRKDLDYILSQANPSTTLSEQIAWVSDLLHWIRIRSKIPGSTTALPNQLQVVRIRFIFHLLERNPQWREKVGKTLFHVISQTSALRLFSETGMATETGLFKEFSDRLVLRFLPQPNDARDLAQLFSKVFPTLKDADWIKELPEDSLTKIALLFREGTQKDPFVGVRSEMAEALFLLTAQATGAGLRGEILRRSPQVSSIQESPFFQLNQSVTAYLREFDPHSGDNEKAKVLVKSIRDCKHVVDHVFEHLENEGVSVALVYELEKISSCFQRMEDLLALLGGAKDSRVANFVAQLVQEQASRKSVRAILAATFHQLARKIVERAGESGEHYITRTKEEYRKMFRSGALGGFLMSFTTFIKYWLTSLKAPLFIEGMLCSLNYAGSFVLIYIVGATVATKQPAMTAPNLAGKLENIQDARGLRAFVDEIAKISRSQFIAVIGNTTVVFVCVVIGDLILFGLTKQHYFSAERAEYVLHTLDPVNGLSILYGCITGVLLWASSIMAGTLENWIVYRRLPEAIAQSSSFHLFLGKKGSERLAKTLAKHTSGMTGNIALGFMLGMLPVFGTFLGLPLDIRHVTLASGALGLVAAAQGVHALSSGPFLLAFFGVICIGIANFTVSFLCSLMVAIKARNIQAPGQDRIRAAIFQAFRQSPKDFFFPKS